VRVQFELFRLRVSQTCAGHFTLALAGGNDTISPEMYFRARCILLFVGLSAVSLCAADSAWNFDQLCALAAARAAAPYKDTSEPLPPTLARLSYDELRCIEYDANQAVWRAENLPFRLMMYPLGGPLQKQSVSLNVVRKGLAEPLPFEARRFLFHQVPVNTDELTNTLGFAGFRVLNQVNKPGKFDELISFLGASYFRALGRGQYYGTSVRGLAVNSCCELPEEFPRFVAFWITQPDAHATNIVIDALLDSYSVAGAYRFTVQPGEDTVVDVRCVLYARRPVPRYGLGTLTSMFWFGENSANHFGDFRPEVHDADGLLVGRGDGSWIWRPLRNAPFLQETRVLARHPRGFGLLQRDRRFTSYEDIEANYHKRPSVWVEPLGDWGSGYVMLAELTADNEYGDNIVAYWQPSTELKPGVPLAASWRLHWYLDNPDWPPLTRVVNSFVSGREVVLDFLGHGLSINTDDEPIPDITLDHGQIRNVHLQVNHEIKGWRLGFEVRDTIAGKAATVQVVLRDKTTGDALSETWTYPLMTH